MAHPLTFTAEIGRSAAAAAAVDAMHLASPNDDLAHTCADLNNIMYISKDTFFIPVANVSASGMIMMFPDNSTFKFDAFAAIRGDIKAYEHASPPLQRR